MLKIKSLNLRQCTSREAGIHGFYAGFTEAAFSALLAQAYAATFFYSILIHGGSFLTLVAQTLGAKRALNSVDRRRDLAFFCFMQSAFLYILFFYYLINKMPGIGLAITVCLVSLGSLFFGTFSSSTWHSTWASCFSGAERRNLLNFRTFKMTSASFVAVILSSLLMKFIGSKFTLLILLGLAASAKLFSAYSLWNAKNFGAVEQTEKRAGQKTHTFPKLNQFILILYFGLGLSVAFLIPYLNKELGFGADQIFVLGLTQILGQLLLTAILCKVRSILCAKKILKISVLMLSLLPLTYCISEAYRTWQLIFLLSGIASAALGLGTQYLIQAPEKADEVVNKLTSISVSSTLAQVLGGLSGGMLLGLGIFNGPENYYFIFVLAACFRMLSLFISVDSRKPLAEIYQMPSSENQQRELAA